MLQHRLGNGITVKTAQTGQRFFRADTFNTYLEHGNISLPSLYQKLDVGGDIEVPSGHSVVLWLQQMMVIPLPDDLVVYVVG